MSEFGTALGNGFVLQEATIMIGPLGQALDLTIEDHSLGLFKNLAIANDKQYASLSQGVQQDVVHQTLTGNNFTISGNGYEYNPRTIMYALNQAGFTADPTAPKVVLNVAVNAAAATSSIEVTSATGVLVGDWIQLAPSNGLSEGMAYQVKTITTNTLGLDRPLVSPVVMGDKLHKSTLIYTSELNGTKYYSAKIISEDSEGRPMTFIVPKLMISSGLNVNFGSGDYSNMAFSAMPMACIPTDASYALYLANQRSKLFLFTT